MNKHSQENPDPALDRALREWKVEESLPPRFRERVWQRLERAQTQSTVNPWTRFSGWLAGVMSRPALALGYMTLFLVLGLTAGYWQAQAHNARDSQELGARYVRMMDPYHHPAK